MSIASDPWVWFGSLATLAILSGILWKDNDFFRGAENIFIGASSGYYFYIAFKNLVDLAWLPLARGQKPALIIPVALGVMLYARYIKKYAWLSRWGTAFLIAVGSGLSIFAAITSQFIAQIRANLLPLTSFNNVVMVVTSLSVLMYFFFSFERKEPLTSISTLGRWAMMVTFGVSFGNVVMGRISLLLGVLDRILGSWLGLI